MVGKCLKQIPRVRLFYRFFIIIPRRDVVDPYAISKGALKQFTQAVSNEWSSRGIRVNSIAPGYIKTNLTDSMSEENKKIVDLRIPMKRWGNPDDFMGPIVYLTSDASKYVTGDTLLVDGGWMGR